MITFFSILLILVLINLILLFISLDGNAKSNKENV